MGYWDFIPSGWHHTKKPLTKKQLQKMREWYEKGNMIAEHVQSLEDQEKNRIKKEIDDELNSAFL